MTMTIKPSSMALIAALALATPTIAAAAPTTDVAAEHVQASASDQTAPAASTQAEKSDAQNYAQREKQDKNDSFVGGNVVVIGVSGTALLLFLLILLLV
jgi:hypothetical protein